MGAFVWSIYIMVWAGILYYIEKYSVSGWTVSAWSFFDWAVLISVLVCSGLGIAIAMQYILDYWYADYQSRLIKKMDKRVQKKEIKKKIEEKTGGLDFQVD